MSLRRPLLLCSAFALALATPWAQAAKDDRAKPLNLVFDREGAIDKVKQRSEFNGNVIMTKGSMVLRAERMDVQETSDGYYQAYANGTSGKQVQFRQDRDTPGERIEGRADQIEYDTRTETIRLVGNAEARVMQGDQLKQALSGATLNYDNRTERLVVETGAASPHPSGRGRVVLMPRNPPVEPPPASSAPLGLRPSVNLTPRQPQQ
ncbi:lipopolysaccharide transport periplasmic protein LptA [Roseateles aquatilis]|uniref:Lipopolysaccharide export system protein LptA n=1 Tax=Roseateles aquatilis TaxID=431061 RepID=A0A246J793_9BURK|nr:lipopolysaccharide transport periplasmic protein LptA [Roseateles aquatilis]OWQ88427.1 lipopolysaccharide transport periplasmic protein LptA [Roseateles aquatilis]